MLRQLSVCSVYDWCPPQYVAIEINFICIFGAEECYGALWRYFQIGGGNRSAIYKRQVPDWLPLHVI